jgi:hypothetical protein
MIQLRISPLERGFQADFKTGLKKSHAIVEERHTFYIQISGQMIIQNFEFVWGKLA